MRTEDFSKETVALNGITYVWTPREEGCNVMVAGACAKCKKDRSFQKSRGAIYLGCPSIEGQGCWKVEK